MKKMNVLFVAFLLTNCSNIETMGDNYYYLSDDEAIDIGYPYGSMFYRSKEKSNFEEVLIYADVIQKKFNDEYIIIKQQPNKKLLINKIKQNLEFWNNYYLENRKDSLVEIGYDKMTLKDIQTLLEKNKKTKKDIVADSLFRQKSCYKKIFKNKTNYYIIEKTTDSIFGPLNIKDFKNIKARKKVDLEF
ncbi:hypothetical protein [Flavobacterium gyeonganense]|uniref:Lipoprotein n=1 Tax=Flavobacterium gyeonganense TaxID=1310418 RepID=A0ABV5HD11_9FLAO|nr:hypothetical protein [Flavobacterium gyeonganense]